jgi:murein DD-endopeptidase MepM/ murein hydrolase activator NlpD
MGLVVIMAACGSTLFPETMSKADQRAWINAQQARFDALSTAYVPNAVWREVYEQTARKIWSYGHQGMPFPHDALWPLRDTEPTRALVTSGFGDIVNTVGYLRTTGPHSGIDVPAPRGTPVYAAQAGEISAAKRHIKWGGYVAIRHNDMVTSYMHLDDIAVKDGEFVERGQLVGTTGMTGTTSGLVPHLHFAVKMAGEYKDPMPLFPARLQWPL